MRSRVGDQGDEGGVVRDGCYDSVLGSREGEQFVLPCPGDASQFAISLFAGDWQGSYHLQFQLTGEHHVQLAATR